MCTFSSATFLIQTLVGFTMALVTRKSNTSIVGIYILKAHLQYETDAYTDVPFTGHELWSLQEDGDLCTSIYWPHARHILIPSQRAKPATKREMTQFHSDDYVEFLSRIVPRRPGKNAVEEDLLKCECSSG